MTIKTFAAKIGNVTVYYAKECSGAYKFITERSAEVGDCRKDSSALWVTGL